MASSTQTDICMYRFTFGIVNLYFLALILYGRSHTNFCDPAILSNYRESTFVKHARLVCIHTRWNVHISLTNNMSVT